MPALRHLETASGTVERGGSIMDRSPTKHRLELGKFMESVSNWKVSGNSFSGRYKWQKPEKIFQLVWWARKCGRKRRGSALAHGTPGFNHFSRHAGCAKTLNPISQVLQLDFAPFSFSPPFSQALTQHSLPHAPQLHVGCLESFCLLTVQRLFLAVDHYGAAPLQNPLWGTFHHQQEAFVLGVVGLVDGELCHKQERLEELKLSSFASSSPWD